MGNYLIVGLGNPGTKYEKTRHNLGFIAVEAFAKKQGLVLKRGWRLNGRVASGSLSDLKIHLLLPSTYMNLSGVAVRKAMHYYKIALSSLLVIVDDVYLKFGTMRLRASGSSGGHNGLKNIDASLATNEYSRLRIGVGPEDEELLKSRTIALEDYVLAPFTQSEQQMLPQVIDKSLLVIEEWLLKT